MLDKLIGVAIGYMFCKLFQSGGLLSQLLPTMSSTTSFQGTTFQGGVPAGYTHTTMPSGATPSHIPPGAIPSVSPGAIPVAASAVPAGLPPFPTGWTFAKTTQAIVQRAWALLPILKLGQVQYETAPGDPNKWLAYRKEPHAGNKTGVTVYTPKNAATAAPGASPGFVPPPAMASPGAAQPGLTYASTAAPGPSPAPGAPRTLRRGMAGPDVAEWQRFLGIPADGKFGPQTESATKAYQSAHGLKPDGIVGPKTLAQAHTVTAGDYDETVMGDDLDGEDLHGPGDEDLSGEEGMQGDEG